MSWVVNVTIDTDKSNVGTATAVFTDTDQSTFTATGRATMTAANASSFSSQAIAGRNAWQARKTAEANARNSLVNDLEAATPPETAVGVSQANDGSIVVVLPM